MWWDKIFINIFSKKESFLTSSSNKKAWLRRFLFLIGISWLVFILFLIIDQVLLEDGFMYIAYADDTDQFLVGRCNRNASNLF